MALFDSFKISKKIIYSLLVLAGLFLAMNNSYAFDDPGARPTTPNNSGDVNPDQPWTGDKYQCDVQDIDWDPFPFTNTDMDWEFTNPSCAAYIATAYATNKAAGKFASWACGKIAQQSIIDEAAAVGVVFSPAEAKQILDNGTQCTTVLQGAAKALCCTATIAQAAALANAIAQLQLIWAVANEAHEKARICGRYWNTWDHATIDAQGNKSADWSQSAEYGNWNDSMTSYTQFSGSYENYLRQKYNAKKMTLSIANKEFRELIYGGVEYQATADVTQGGESNACKNPAWSDDTKNKILGYNDEYQRYYMRGAGKQANYACERFLVNSTQDERKAGVAAYDCCIKKSQTNICIESESMVSGYDYKFCELGTSRCQVKDVWYDIFESKKTANAICARTYSVCPFNHLLGGGTEVNLPENANNCQYLKHCVLIPSKPYFRKSNLTGAFISGACYDLKGDTQNSYSFNNDLININGSNNLNFSAPIAQCFHETLYNIFLNKAGHIECNDANETPTKDGKCDSGEKFVTGENLPGMSFFETLQSNLRGIIKMVLSLAVMVMGYQVLMGGQLIERKEISMFIIKLGLIMYFALGTAWQEQFFSGVFKAPMILSNMFIHIDSEQSKILAISKDNPIQITVDSMSDKAVGNQIRITGVPEIPQLNNQLFTISDASFNTPPGTFRLKNIKDNSPVDGGSFPNYKGNGGIPVEDKLDGCQFPKYNYADTDETTKYSNPKYPPGSEYLAIWDTMDCKIARSLGMGPDASVPTLLLIIAASIFTGGLGVLFSFAALIFTFFLLSIVVRALHMFLLSTIAIVLLIYVSPVMITLALFKRTNGMFKKWWSNLLGFSLQPLILFAYLGVLITIYNMVIIGNITYQGNGRDAPKQEQCYTGSTIADSVADGAVNAAAGLVNSASNTFNTGTSMSTQDTSSVLNIGPKDSIYCIFAELGIKSTTIQQLGIPIPSLSALQSGRLTEILSTVVKASFLMFIFSQFFSKMSTLASVLVGGAVISGISGGVVGSITQTEGINVMKAVTGARDKIKGFGERGRRLGKNTAIGAAKKVGSTASRGAKGLGRDINLPNNNKGSGNKP